MTVTVFGYLIIRVISTDFTTLFLRYLRSLVSTGKIYQTLKIVFDHISKYQEIGRKYSVARCVFNSPPGVWKCGQTGSIIL